MHKVALASLLVAFVGCSSGESSSSGGADGSGGNGGSGGAGLGGEGAGTVSSGGGPLGGHGGADEGGGGAGSGGGPIGDDGYGELAGTCGDVDLEDLLSPTPQILTNTLDFSAEPPLTSEALTPGGRIMEKKGNLGGSSLYSEVFAFEVLDRCDEAELLKTEGQIVYAIEGKKTDLLVEIDGEKVGVSVVRAMSYPEGADYPVEAAYEVLEGKLSDILLSSENVAPKDAWTKQILSVLAQTEEHEAAILAAYAELPADVKADTIVVVTTTLGEDAFIYYGD